MQGGYRVLQSAARRKAHDDNAHPSKLQLAGIVVGSRGKGVGVDKHAQSGNKRAGLGTPPAVKVMARKVGKLPSHHRRRGVVVSSEVDGRMRG